MSIEITIVRSPGSAQNTKPGQIFSEQGGTIGRASGNTWVLEDPEKFISSKHSAITYENGHYYLSDLSTNGTFFNGSREPIGNGNRVALKDGDKFVLGDYEFLVSMRDAGQGAPGGFGDPFGPGTFLDGRGSGAPTDVGFFSGGDMRQGDPYFGPPVDLSPSIEPLLTPGPTEKDPLVAMGFSPQSPSVNSSGYGTQRDDGNPTQDPVKWPNAIPQNWLDDDLPVDPQPPLKPPVTMPVAAVDPQLLAKLQKSEERRAALEIENEKLLADIVLLKHQLSERSRKPVNPAPAPVRSMTAGDETLIEAMGLSRWNLTEQKKAEISQIAGALVRETMVGLMQALSFRKKIKEEFRINVTTIQPVENNPLKFSANLEDALENMFIKDNKAYQRPLEAVREGFHGISEHQVAVLAGIQAAFKGMLERLDPESLEQRFEKYRKAGVIKVGQKGKNWDSYKEFHRDLVSNIDNSFQHLFGYDFVQAYEDQLQRLLAARKAKTGTKDY